jgi:hypothetical protein
MPHTVASVTTRLYSPYGRQHNSHLRGNQPCGGNLRGTHVLGGHLRSSQLHGGHLRGVHLRWLHGGLVVIAL